MYMVMKSSIFLYRCLPESYQQLRKLNKEAFRFPDNDDDTTILSTTTNYNNNSGNNSNSNTATVHPQSTSSSSMNVQS